MFTPDDLSNINFTKTGKNAYKADEVDEFIVFVQNLTRKMNIEKKELDNKIIILAEKIEEYRKDEDSLRAALLG
ncbi:MAG: DivIVA domain-containing protein, partial [Clostridia bacterium]